MYRRASAATAVPQVHMSGNDDTQQDKSLTRMVQFGMVLAITCIALGIFLQTKFGT